MVVISPPGSDSLQSGLKFEPRCFIFFLFIYFPARDLRDAWADWHEILHDGQY